MGICVPHVELTNRAGFPNYTQKCINIISIFILLYIRNNFIYWLSYSGLLTEQDGCMGAPKLTVLSNNALDNSMMLRTDYYRSGSRQLFGFFSLLWYNPAGSSAPHLYSLTLHPQHRIGERIKKKRWNSWVEITTVNGTGNEGKIIIKNIQNVWRTKQLLITCWLLPSQSLSKGRTIPLLSLGQLSFCCPLPAQKEPRSPWLHVSTAQLQLKHVCYQHYPHPTPTTQHHTSY